MQVTPKGSSSELEELSQAAPVCSTIHTISTTGMDIACAPLISDSEMESVQNVCNEHSMETPTAFSAQCCKESMMNWGEGVSDSGSAKNFSWGIDFFDSLKLEDNEETNSIDLDDANQWN